MTERPGESRPFSFAGAEAGCRRLLVLGGTRSRHPGWVALGAVEQRRAPGIARAEAIDRAYALLSRSKS